MKRNFLKCWERDFMEFNVTITRTGGITVEAENADEAISKVLEMSVSEIENSAELTGWEPSDADILE